MPELFDRKAVAWVKQHYPGSNPVHGTVTFQTDVSFYGVPEADIDVTWTEVVRHYLNNGQELPSGTRDVRKTIESKAFDYDLNGLMAELVEMDDPGD